MSKMKQVCSWVDTHSKELCGRISASDRCISLILMLLILLACFGYILGVFFYNSGMRAQKQGVEPALSIQKTDSVAVAELKMQTIKTADLYTNTKKITKNGASKKSGKRN